MMLMPDKIDEVNLCQEAGNVEDAVAFCYRREFDSETGFKMIVKARVSLARIEAAILRRTEKAERENRGRKNSYEKWLEKAFTEDVQARIDGFANADESADECERAFRAGWMAYMMLAPTFEKEEGQ